MNLLCNINSTVLESQQEYYDVSICIITYNKQAYIRKTIDSVLAQKTTCTYEIVVGDNASTDQTQTILKEYYNKFPHKMCIVMNKENLGLTTNMFNTMCKAKGKYIIILYGDDYWINENKMQKEFDFLETNNHYIGVTAPVEFRYSNEENCFRVEPSRSRSNRSINLSDYLHGYDYPMAGLMFRNDVFSENQDYFRKMIDFSLYVDDASFCILLLMLGDVYILPEIMSVYRCFRKEDHANNFNSVNSEKKRVLLTISLFNEMGSVFTPKIDLSTRYGLILSSAFVNMLRKNMTMDDYREIVLELPIEYYRKKHKILFEGICRKLELIIRRHF